MISDQEQLCDREQSICGGYMNRCSDHYCFFDLPVKLEVIEVGEDYVEVLPFPAYVKKDLRGLVDRLLYLQIR